MPVVFWRYFASALSDTTFVTSVAPSENCLMQANCVAYYLTGGMSAITPRPIYNDSTLAVYNSPGVQVEYYSPASNDSFIASDCQVYGAKGAALELCVKQNSDQILVGCLSLVLCLFLRMGCLSHKYSRRGRVPCSYGVGRHHLLLDQSKHNPAECYSHL